MVSDIHNNLFSKKFKVLANINQNIILAESLEPMGTGKPVGKLLKNFISENIEGVKK